MYVKRNGKLVKITKKSIGAVSPSTLNKKRAAFERKKQTSAFKRWRIYQYKVANKRSCSYCGHRFTGAIYTDHYIPLFRKGTSAYSNLRVVCKMCNDYKGIRLPNDVLMSELRNGRACNGLH